MSLRRREDTLQVSFKTIEAVEPALHEMYVLQHDPVTFLRAIEDGFLSTVFLTLTHGNINETSIVRSDVISSSDSLDFRSGIDTWEEYEEDGHSLRGFCEGFSDAERWLLNVSFTHLFMNESTECRWQSIRSECSKNEQSVEWLQILEGFRKISGFGFFFTVPFLPLEDISF
jgi:hypothetical protein